MKIHREAHRKHREALAEAAQLPPAGTRGRRGQRPNLTPNVSQLLSGTHTPSLPPASMAVRRGCQGTTAESTLTCSHPQSSPETPPPPGLGGAFPAALGPGARPFKELVLQYPGRMEFTPRTPGNCLFTVRGAAEAGDWRVSFSHGVGDTPRSLWSPGLRLSSAVHSHGELEARRPGSARAAYTRSHHSWSVCSQPSLPVA